VDFIKPVVVYTANGNLEAHSVVTWLESNGVASYAVEDNSGASLFAFGTISQFHKPQVFVDNTDMDRARTLMREFEATRNKHRKRVDAAAPINAECEECGATSEFPASQDGTTQNCPVCNSFMDVGVFDWPDDYATGDGDAEIALPDNAEEAIDAAAMLDQGGDWNDAIAAYQVAAQRWPEHAAYVDACIASIQRKLDAAN